MVLMSLGCNRVNEGTMSPPSGSPDPPDHYRSNESSSQDANFASGSSMEQTQDHSQPSANSGMLRVEIVTDGHEVGGGLLLVAFYDGPKTFNKVNLAKWKDGFEANGQPIQIELEKSLFPSNELAIAVYQDSNSNNQLDKNAFGIPQEAYGFSNNPKRGFGPPKYAEVAVPITAEKLGLTIKLQ